MSALYDIANEYAALLNEDLEPELIADTIEGMEGEFSDKVEQLLAIIKNQKAYAEALKEESKKLADRAKAYESRNESIRQYIIENMAKLERKSMKAGIHEITVRKPVQTVSIDNADDLPVDLVDYRTTTVPDKTAIKLKLKAGEEVAGASLKTGKPSLIVK